MIRLRVSTIEAFRRVVDTDYAPEEELVATLKRGQWTDGPANWQMLAGTAWHRAMALEPADDVLEWPCGTTACCYGDYSFDSGDIQEALAYCGPGLREITGRRVLCNWHGEAVEIEGTADLVQGLVVTDHKTKFSQADPSDYEESLQWRLYLLIHEAQVFRYNLWEMKDPVSGYCALKDVYSFRLWPYPWMKQDCLAWICRFLSWANDKDLIRTISNERRAA